MVGPHAVVGEEGLRRLFRKVDVAPTDLCAADDELPSDPDGQRVAEGIRYVELCVDDGCAHRDGLAAGHDFSRAAHSRLRRAVHVEYHAVLPQGAQTVIEAGGEGLRADIEEGQLTHGIEAFGNVQQTEQIGGRAGDPRHAIVADELSEQRGVVDLLLRGDDHVVAAAQRHKCLNDGHIEGEGRQREAHAAGFGVVHDLNGFRGPVDIVGDVAVLDHHALGAARRAGRVDAVGQIPRQRLHRRDGSSSP